MAIPVPPLPPVRLANFTVQPLLKWPGGKRKLVQHILGAFPPEVAGAAPWHEPFVGSAAVALAAQAPSGVLADINSRLINFHRVVGGRPHGLWRHLSGLPAQDWRGRYVEIRDEFNDFDPEAANFHTPQGVELSLRLAAYFLWLNKACFNGLYRENAKGEYNVPPGSYEVLSLPEHDDIMRVHRGLLKYAICCQPWQKTVAEAPRGSRLYVDPPYDPLSKTAAFTTYSRKPFTWDDQVALAVACDDAVSRGVHVVASNNGTERIRALWAEHGFTCREVPGVKRSISCKGGGRGAVVPEVLFTSWADAPGRLTAAELDADSEEL